MPRVINTPFLIVQDEPGKMFYLYGGNQWYSSADVKSGWKLASSLPKSIQAIDQEIKKQAKDTGKKPEVESPARDLMVLTEPAELIQSKGEADFATIQGTHLLSMKISLSELVMYKR